MRWSLRLPQRKDRRYTTASTPAPPSISRKGKKTGREKKLDTAPWIPTRSAKSVIRLPGSTTSGWP